MIRWILPLGLLFVGCLDGTEVEGQTFPCRRPEDCVEGYVCHPSEWICVPEGSVDLQDAGAADVPAGD